MFDALREHLSDEAILEFTYITMTYTMHAVMSVALRLEFDERDDPIVEIAAPEGYEAANLGRQISGARRRRSERPHGPLTGVRVLELGNFIAGPFAGQLLGDYGADVIKVEAPGDGDPMRRWGVTPRRRQPVVADHRPQQAVGRARPEAGRGAARSCATWSAHCDVVLENFRPGVLDKWGLGYDDARRTANPALVLVHVSGFGQTGPLAGQAGFGSVGEAMGGIRHTTGSPDRPPSRAGISLGDALASVFARDRHAGGAACRRARTGVGQEVDVAIYEAVAALMESTMADYELGGVVRTRSGSVLPGVAPSNVYPTSDGAEVVIAANADGVFARLCKAMGERELADDARFATHQARGDEHGRARRARRRVDGHAAVRRGAGAARRARRARRADLHRARHAPRPAVPRPRDGAARHVDAGLGRADDRAWSRGSPDTPGAIRHPGPALGRAHRRGARRAARPRPRRSSPSCTPPA